MITIGNTGVGKSSLIQLLSGIDVKVSAGAKRGTSAISKIQSKYDKNLYFIDTIGLQDYKKDWTDETLLKRTLRYIHHERFRNIKILFCVAGDTDTRMGLFSKPAEFIGNLKVDDTMDHNLTKLSIWDSVLVIKKRGNPLLDNVSGVFAAAMEHGASDGFKSHKHVFGFKCVDWYNVERDDPEFKYVPKEKHEELIICLSCSNL